MWLFFRGTRGEIEARTVRHHRHSSALVWRSGHPPIALDCGKDWLGVSWGRVPPAAILLTHAHADHAEGLRSGAPCPVYATAATWDAIGTWDIRQRVVLPSRRPVLVAGLVVEAVPVMHSLIAPAVGYRISEPESTVFYVPDVARIPHPGRTLAGVDAYVGDGATIARPLLRTRNGVPIGHASIREQVHWCRAAGVGRAIFTHCGSAIVSAGESAEAEVRALGDRTLRVSVAFDGWRCRIGSGRASAAGAGHDGP
jgi:phosphoribosyl 1,2-cyclic phosphodiesterase